MIPRDSDDGELREAELAGEALADILVEMSGGAVEREPYEGWSKFDYADAEADQRNDIEREEGL